MIVPYGMGSTVGHPSNSWASCYQRGSTASYASTGIAIAEIPVCPSVCSGVVSKVPKL